MYFHNLTGFALSQVKEPKLSCQQVGLKLCYSVSWVCIHSSVHVNNQYYFFQWVATYFLQLLNAETSSYCLHKTIIVHGVIFMITYMYIVPYVTGQNWIQL